MKKRRMRRWKGVKFMVQSLLLVTNIVIFPLTTAQNGSLFLVVSGMSGCEQRQANTCGREQRQANTCGREQTTGKHLWA